MQKVKSDVPTLLQELSLAQKVKRAKDLIEEAYQEFGDKLVVAHSMGKDSQVVWDLAKRVSKDIPGFIVQVRFMPEETKKFIEKQLDTYPELKVYRNDEPIPDKLYSQDPDRCCKLLKVKPTRWALEEMEAKCWITGLRYTEGRTRTNFKEIEQRDKDLVKLNPILTWKEREVWQYLAVNQVSVNPLYRQGYRSLGCAPCTQITPGASERAGRWAGTSKQGGECGMHTCPIKVSE